MAARTAVLHVLAGSGYRAEPAQAEVCSRVDYSTLESGRLVANGDSRLPAAAQEPVTGLGELGAPGARGTGMISSWIVTPPTLGQK